MAQLPPTDPRLRKSNSRWASTLAPWPGGSTCARGTFLDAQQPAVHPCKVKAHVTETEGISCLIINTTPHSMQYANDLTPVVF